MDKNLEQFSPHFIPEKYTEEESRNLAPFFTNLEKPVYVPLIFSPELIGALCSRTSRATKDLRHIYLHEFINPFLNPVRVEKDTDKTWKEKVAYGKELKNFVDFLHKHSTLDIFSNPRARSFYITWLAQYGDDSIAQMAGMHVGFAALSQVAIKHYEDQRIGLAPIEKSTRYVDYREKIGGHYLYYTDPTLRNLGLYEEYERVMNNLFHTYTLLIPKLTTWLSQRFPQEKASVVEKKAFDTLRGLLPNSTLSQVAFFGNGQAFEYMISRSRNHSLGEIRWGAQAAEEELDKVGPSFFRRLKDEEKRGLVEEYQEYLAGKSKRVDPLAKEFLADENKSLIKPACEPTVTLLDYDKDGENKIIAGMLYSSPSNHNPWQDILKKIAELNSQEKRKIIDAYMQGRTKRFQKVGRAFENAYVRFEIVMNIGAWRDLQRHRMLTQQRQNFSCHHGYDVPPEITDSGLETEFRAALDPVAELFQKIVRTDPDLAQYATTMAHRLRFMQWENLRQSFWQIELRSIPEGHPDYRHIVQKKFYELEKVYPLIAERMLVNLGEYDFARRGQEERIQKKLAQLKVD